jgi:hypothetical protein
MIGETREGLLRIRSGLCRLKDDGLETHARRLARLPGPGSPGLDPKDGAALKLEAPYARSGALDMHVEADPMAGEDRRQDRRKRDQVLQGVPAHHVGSQDARTGRSP